MTKLKKLSLFDLSKDQSILSPEEMQEIYGGNDPISDSDCVFANMSYMANHFGGTSTTANYITLFSSTVSGGDNQNVTFSQQQKMFTTYFSGWYPPVGHLTSSELATTLDAGFDEGYVYSVNLRAGQGSTVKHNVIINGRDSDGSLIVIDPQDSNKRLTGTTVGELDLSSLYEAQGIITTPPPTPPPTGGN